MRILVAVALLVAGLIAPASGSDYTFDSRPVVKFFGSGAERISPYPMSPRAASVWLSDECWKDCTGQGAWRFEACIRSYDPEHCRAKLDQSDRSCLRACRLKGGPAVLPFY